MIYNENIFDVLKLKFCSDTKNFQIHQTKQSQKEERVLSSMYDIISREREREYDDLQDHKYEEK